MSLIFLSVAVTTLLFFALGWFLFKSSDSGDDDVAPMVKLREIDTTAQRLVDNILSGEYHTIFKGMGVEYDESRAYQPGDDARYMDWRLTARTGEAHIKLFKEERELTIILMADLSASGAFGSKENFKMETAARVCAAMAFSAIRNSDKVGLIAFTDKIEVYSAPKKGKRHVMRLIRDILYHKPEGKKTDIAEALLYLNKVVKKRAVVFLVSDFLDSNYEKALSATSKKHDLIAIKVVDKREMEIPDVGIVALEDGETGAMAVANFSGYALRNSYKKEAKEAAERLSKTFASCGIDQIIVPTEGDYVEPIIRFFKARERRRSFGR